MFSRSILWCLADSGTCKNFISSRLYFQLPHRVELKPIVKEKVIAGNGKEMDVLGRAIFKIKVCDKQLYHLFGVVNNLPVEVLIGGEFLKAHGCTLTYAPTGRNRFDLGVNECNACQANKQILRDNCDPQIVEFEEQSGTNSKSVMVKRIELRMKTQSRSIKRSCRKY